MKFSSPATIAAALAGQAVAFPTLNLQEPKQAETVVEMRDILQKRQAFGVNVGFDAAKQYISTTGQYAFVPPGPGDLRGVCPGLNAAANHNYLPHNGYATISQYVQGVTTTFGMGEDLAGFLAIYGAIFDGDLTSWSMGGVGGQGLISGLTGALGLQELLGAPTGLTGSHNRYESDVSPTRGDLYQSGQNYDVIMDYFKGMYALQSGETEETSNYDINLLTSWRVKRFNESLTQNPYFFNGPFSGVLVQPAAYTFIFRFMANHSAEFPEGRLSQNNLKSFFSITGDTPDQFVYTPGHESIPDNWYRRAFGDEYTIPFFLLDVVEAAGANPQFLDIGGNVGSPNSFVGVDLQNITGGLFNGATLLEGNNLGCFVFELLFQASPDILQPLNQDLIDASQTLAQAIDKASTGLNCPQLKAIDKQNLANQFSQFPGVTMLQKDGTYDNTKQNLVGSQGELLPNFL